LPFLKSLAGIRLRASGTSSLFEDLGEGGGKEEEKKRWIRQLT
jgi:hypothetical protein